MTYDPALTFAIALVAGVLAQAVGVRLRVPGIVVLLLTGFLVGPDVLAWVQPDALGGGLQVIVGMSVAVILFEGGMTLGLERLRREALTIRRLITLGALVTTIGGTFAAWLFMDWDATLALLFGTLVMVTGPTVIIPLLRRVRVTANVKTILEAEGVLIDPIGAIVAVVAFEVVVMATSPSSAAASLLGLPGRLALGFTAGVLGGLLIGAGLRRNLIPDDLLNIFALAAVVALYQVCETILSESGIMAAPIAGIVVGNMEHRLKRELTVFKEQLTVMLVGLLFVLLVADVRISEVMTLGSAGVLTVLFMMVVIRPAAVFLSTLGSGLALRERLFIAWLGPRGIVAAAVASLFAERLAQEGAPNSTALRALVFLVIGTTVVIQGGLSPIVARLLGVRRPEDNGWVIVGANPLARLLGRVLQRSGEDVLLIDTNAQEVRRAEAAGLRVLQANASEERTLGLADVESRRGLVTLTPNDSINLYLARHAGELFHVRDSLVGLSRDGNVRPEQVEERGKQVLFGRPIAVQPWHHRLMQRPLPQVELWRVTSEANATFGAAVAGDDREGADLLVLAVERDGTIRPIAKETRINIGDLLYVVRPSYADDSPEELEARGWRREGVLDDLVESRDRRSDPRRLRGSPA